MAQDTISLTEKIHVTPCAFDKSAKIEQGD
jgi:hypothetical protein